MEKEVINQDTAGKVQNKVQCPNKERSPDEHSAPMEEKHSETVVGNRGDCKPESQKNEKPATIKEPNSDTSHTRTQEASETTISPPQDDKKDDQIEGFKSEKKEEMSATDNTHCQSGDEFSEEETQSTNTNQDGFCEESLDSDRAHSQEHTVTAATASSSQRADFSDTIQNGSSAEKEMLSVAEGRSPDKDGTQMEKKIDLSQAEDKQSSPKNAKPVTIQEPKSDESPVTKNEASELIISQIVNEEMDDQVNEPKPELNEKSSATNNSDNRSGEAPEETRDKHESTTRDKQQLEDRSNDVETIGPITPEATQPDVPQVTGGSGKYLIAVAIVALVAILVQYFLQPESPPQTNDVRQIDVFLRQLEKVKTLFPNQRAELWNRSRIHLKRHLQTAHPTEPVSLILTAGLRAEKTLSCLAQGLASAFSSALNASVLHIDGASKASQDSDEVKLDIDRKLQGAFEGDKPVAVIHRFEELPPGSTLIFYRYCDHENAAYKKTFLIFTVLLGEEDEIPAKISLCAVEEMVDDHLQKKFLAHGHPVSFDMMDLDKYGGLWSRISHLILPVAAEERIELEGC